MSLTEWKKYRGKAIRKLLYDLNNGKVDSEIASWLYEFNLNHEKVYTSSSCSGRAVIMYGKDFLDKKGSRMICSCHKLEKCHKYLCPYALEASALVKDLEFIAWAALHPPIIHFITINENIAEIIISCALSSGFTHSGMRKSKKLGYIIEVRAFDKLHLILPVSCGLLLKLCEMLEVYKMRLSMFMMCINEKLR